MDSLELLDMIIVVSAAVVAITVGLNTAALIYEDIRTRKHVEEWNGIREKQRISNETTAELYGPVSDQKELSEFFDFWVTLSEEQKDDYLQLSWIGVQ